MPHAYTPGLRVTARATVRRERRLPLRGAVLVVPGERVEPHTVVARCELPGDVQAVNLAARLALDPARAPSALVRPVGSVVRKGEPVARARGLFGLVTTVVEAPADGVVESVSPVTGQLLLREAPLPVEVRAYVRGTVAEVLPEEGAVIEARGAFLQGIFGVGGEAWGPIAVATAGPAEPLTPDRLRPEHRGAVVVGGSHVPYATLERARALGVAAIVVGGLDDLVLRRLLGRDLGVAITGEEDLGLTLVITEGFGRIPMAQRAWDLLGAHAGAAASVSGATQIRAGVVRPEIIVPLDGDEGAGPPAEAEVGLAVGAQVRVIRAPHFGRIAEVVAMPPELHVLDTEALVRVLVVRFADDGAEATVPRANVERIAR
uniref:RnfC Barrel sandwich hybrid domain-containing protein n=1 Tax=Eiseniibacteriota bacterium TaxID=2212470 RepID=A0A832MLH2_UNCEI